VTFDDIRQLALFEDDPEKFMQMYRHRVIFDEVQKAPELFNHIKLAVDRDRNTYGKFVLTGSSQFLLMQNVADSLAGRIGLLSLLPFDHNELPKALCATAIWRGCYPELVTRHYRNADDWYASYIETYLARDVRDVAQIGNLRDFRNLIQLLAAQTAQELNMSRLASDLGVTMPTVKRWISILEMSYVIFLLPPYFRNFGKRVIKRPKIYFYDTGLVSALTGIRTEEMYDRGPMAGALFENYILSQVLKHHKHTNRRSEFYFYRTSHGVEVNLVIDMGQTRHFVEIKKTATFRPRLIKTLNTLASQADTATLIYQGDTLPDYGNIRICNWSNYLTHKKE
ncbi:MAG: ATP-binding protein, partial [Gemmatimonadota bacterium]|nr:ATP-binding protein [Gemmatimonadota bacterium]